jgi:hypothetical protein
VFTGGLSPEGKARGESTAAVVIKHILEKNVLEVKEGHTSAVSVARLRSSGPNIGTLRVPMGEDGTLDNPIA